MRDAVSPKDHKGVSATRKGRKWWMELRKQGVEFAGLSAFCPRPRTLSKVLPFSAIRPLDETTEQRLDRYLVGSINSM